MRNKYINFKKNPWCNKDVYMLEFEKPFYDVICPLRDIDIEKFVPFSYFYVVVDLFGLRPKDFFAYVADKYHAEIEKSGMFKHINFNNIVDANNFANECDARFAKVVDKLGTNG